ncbi:PadR family transcriptional regulator [Insulibacter thermoxylanivorax]|uniref:PadR family transcriptional regulator n=1 Tax=Insulibacter thermoxylanivorax TaxID=2749268 RepID=A0A916QFE2_9BACL|nr:PadR family transcriptional regulator [Insulibacter thermoxylanivorax]GFR38058.1 PadR family transcriptional regulator [Insulibacter thermoxylanivorax]
MERELLVLGLLMSQSQHGYQINEFIDRNLGRVSNMKKATAYAILKRLEKEGKVVSTVSQEGNRPKKQVYTITEQGREAFRTLLRRILTSPEMTVPEGNIGIMFLDYLSLADVVECLNQRLHKIEEKLKVYANIPKHSNQHGLGVDLAIDHRITLMTADRDWLLRTIDILRQKMTNA